MTSREIRRQFIDFFVSQGHAFVPSSPVVPLDDPTLMFTNAGMNQFKPIFLGSERPAHPRVANSQKCIRAGGKHNDLDDVGHDTYHHTFFEMLGNWSFGDYFKKEAIEWAWELLTKVWGIDKSRLHATYFGGLAKGTEARRHGGTQEQSRDREGAGSEPRASARAAPAGNEASKRRSDEGTAIGNRQSPTVNRQSEIEWDLEPDYEARDLWASVTDIDPSHIHPGSMKDNFWEMGDTGPCGPCSEIHIDLTPDKSGAPLVNKGDARVIEIWNLVFIQFNRGADGALTPLPAKHVDTGMGFERLCAVLQGMAAGRLGAFSNYDTDVFTPIFEAIRKRTGAPEYTGSLPEAIQNSEFRIENSDGAIPAPERRSNRTAFELGPLPYGRGSVSTHDQIMIDVSYRVIADHLRCLTFALTDGAIPSNEGRGYVLRRILRRAVRYGRQYLNMHEPFLCDLVPTVVEHMGDVFPELRTAHNGRNVQRVQELIRDEEASFLSTLDRGIRLFNEAAELARTRHHGRISGADAFKLHDTYGFPIDLTELMAEEEGLTIDIGEYERLMEEARGRAKSTSKKFIAQKSWGPGHTTDDIFKYTHLELEAEIRTCTTDDGFNCAFDTIDLTPGDECEVHLNRTCFYAEQGGQVGDRGYLNGPGWVMEVLDTLIAGESVAHRCRVSRGTVPNWFKSGAPPRVLAVVSDGFRVPTMQNHTATHILNWALREVLEIHGSGKVDQKGSLVDPEKTRFDFSHNASLTEEEIARIEDLCAERIRAGLPVYAAMREEDFVDQKAARQINTLRAVFGEKYPDKVRVVSIGVPITEEDARQAAALKSARAEARGSGEAVELDWLLKSPADPKWMQYSVEFCGGTHVKNTAEIEAFTLISEEGVAKGVRRVVGISGDAAKRALALGDELLAEAKALSEPRASARAATAARNASESSRGLKPAAPDAVDAIDNRQSSIDSSLADRVAALQKRLADAIIPLRVRHQIRDILAEAQKTLKESEKAAAKDAGAAVMGRVAALLAEARTVSGVTVVVGEVPAAPVDALRTAIDWVRNKTAASAVLLACVDEGKVTLLAGMSKAAVDRGLKAGDLIKEIAPLVGGKGGGRPDMAQGGGTDATRLRSALAEAAQWMDRRTGGTPAEV
ncbi:MAG: alanine--tRNA ligase [Planctomycetes bacterium]|nr:alanine--tRNA ligase [Planctomycetota bacterium]